MVMYLAAEIQKCKSQNMKTTIVGVLFDEHVEFHDNTTEVTAN